MADYNNRTMSAYASPKLADSPKKWEGETVNEFPLRQYLGGRGGNAVFLSEYQRQKAAIKLITVDNKSFDAQLAYLTSLTTLSHPHLVRTFSAGKCKLDGEQRLYLISEFADEELSQVLPVRALTAEEGRQMLSAVVDALAYVHANGFVHGHVAPANVMVVAEQIKLSADPICRIGHRLRRRESNAYTAPEIDSDPASPAADIWSLGMTLVEALTQRLPSTSENDARIPGSIPEPLQQIARNCLRTKPEERCTTQLISALLSQPEAAVSPRKLSQRRAWLYTGTALAVAVLATTVAPKL